MRLRHSAPLFAVLLLATGCSETKPDCMGDAVICGGNCVELRSDNLNCGACGTTCAAGRVCSGGACAVTCADGLVNCGGKCVDPATDRAFCGASATCAGPNAGTACASGQVCSAGQCGLTCQAGLVDCNGQCTDPLTSRSHCGASGDCAGANGGSACAAGQVCSGGACAPSCQPGLVNCGGTCVDPLKDPRYCGADLACGLGQTCAAGNACDAGQCVLSCQAGLVDCGGKCVDPKTDRSFCGASATCAGADAGSVCAAGQICSGGACTTSCPAGEFACGGKCVDPRSDPNYCGASVTCTGGTACGPSAACYAGLCEPLCPAGQVMCHGSCIDPLTSAAFCGAGGYCTGTSAGAACALDQTCVAGACEPVCTWTQTAAHPLTSPPAGSIPRNGSLGGQGVAAVYGRTAWYQTSDWNILFVPSGFAAADDVFAVEADYYVPPLTTFDREVLIQAFATTTIVGQYQSTLGVRGTMSTRLVGAPTFEWWTQAADGVQTRMASVAVSPFVGAWHRLRLEGLRTSCHTRGFVDGVLVSTWTGACDLSGTYFILQGDAVNGGNSAQVAWSNVAIYKGNTAACVP